MFVPQTCVALYEATVRTTRGAEDAFARASEAAVRSPQKKSSVYFDPKAKTYSYGIQSKSTGGKVPPKGSHVVANISPGTGDEARIIRAPSLSREVQQLSRLAKSSRLSPEERERFTTAALEKKGRRALPSGAITGATLGSYGVPRNRKIASQHHPAKVRTVDALDQLGGVISTAASRQRKRATA